MSYIRPLFWITLLIHSLAAPLAHAQFDFGQSKVEVEIHPATPSVSPGENSAFVVVFDHAEGWHVHTNNPPPIPGFTAIATELADIKVQGATLGPYQWPTSKTIKVDFTGDGPMDYPVFEGRARVFIPFTVAPDAAEVRIAFELIYQACDDKMCEAPQYEQRELVIPVTPNPAAADWHPDFATFDRAVFARDWSAAAPDQPATAGSTFFGFSIPRGIIALLFFAAVGGLVLNLTPCVLPVIPIKVMALSKHAEHPGRALVLGLWMALGVIAFWVGVGLPVALLREAFGDPSQLFGIWWVTLGIGIIIAIMGLGIMGLFEISLPQSVYAFNPKADTAWGSFLFGIMTAVLGLPCFGFVAGALLVGLASMPTLQILAIFAAIGVGMAAPYLILAAKPKWIEKIPRTGPASSLVKQVMGLLLFAAAAYFVGSGIMSIVKSDPLRLASLPAAAKVAHWWAIALFAAAAGFWLILRTFVISRKPLNRTLFSLVGLTLGGVAIWFAAGRTAKAMNDIWIPFTPDTLAAALDRGDTVVLDFTADWCLNCQVLKATVLDRDPVKSQLAAPGVIPMIADLTSRSAPGWQKLADLGQTGIPLLVVFGPGLDQPWQANAYTPSQVLDAINQAKPASLGRAD